MGSREEVTGRIRTFAAAACARSLLRQSNTTDQKILSLLNFENEEVKQENSNKNPVVNSVQRDYMAGEVSKDITARFLLPHDITEAHKLIRSDDEVVYGDSGYLGIEKREEIKNDKHLSSIDYRINRRPKSLPRVTDNAIDWERYIEYRKSAVRCKVEHVFKIIKDTFGFRKVRYKGIAKNLNKLNVLFACANMLMVKRVQTDFRPAKG